VATPPPPPPPPPPPEEVVIEKPRFRPRPTPPPPTAVQVPPVPLKPQPPAESTADATTILSDKQVLDSPVSKPPPKYPQRALEAEKEGIVRVRVTIQADGTVSDVVVVSAKPAGWFESAAMAAVKRWRYKASGRVIIAEVEVEFKLN
jgi:protein TonB